VRVLMAGPDPDAFGGISTVERLMLGQVLSQQEVDVRFVVTHQNGSAALRARVFLKGAAAVVGLLVTRRADVLHLHLSERGSVVRKGLLLHAATILGVPVVLHCHGAEFADELAVMPAARRGLVRGVFSRATHVAVLGEGMVDTVLFAGARAGVVRIAPNPVQLPEHVPSRAPSNRVTALFLGRMSDRKGASKLVRAVALLEPSVRARLQLRMFGDGPVDEIRALVRELGLRDCVFVGGWLAPEARDGELARADVFVLPSCNEGLPMALLEAMAWGLVPLVTPVGAIPEVITHRRNGVLVPPGDILALSLAMADLVGDADLRARTAAAARRTAERYDIRGYLRQWVSVWEELSCRRGSVG
jgi:glycosyltransferase involved in cell wall biosynthesis